MTLLWHIVGPAFFAVLFPLHLAIAIAATVHCLLHKRDVGAALGWIGLVWFAPFLGGFLYFVLGINRVKRRAARLKRHHRSKSHRPEEDAPVEAEMEPLQHGIGRISRRRLEAGNRFTTYQNGDEGYPAMLEAIEAARLSVGLSNYIFCTDKSGRRFIDALKRAQDRGVAVRVIVDGVGSGWVLSRAYHALRRAGVPCGRFLHSPMPWRMPLMNLRSHKKILVVDGAIGFTGGMNIADGNVTTIPSKHRVLDTHFKVTGPVVAQLADAFAEDWLFVCGEELSGPAWFPTLEPDGDATARVVTSGPDQDLEKIEFSIMQAVACARASIYVMTPYFLPDELLVTALTLAAMRGVVVHVVMPEHSNHTLVDWASHANIGDMLKDGVNLWKGPPPFRHTKIMVVDGEWALIGSANWDLRSLRLNFELCMEVYDEPLAQSLQHFIMTHKGKPLTNKEIKARTLPIRLRDSAVRLAMGYL